MRHHQPGTEKGDIAGVGQLAKPFVWIYENAQSLMAKRRTSQPHLMRTSQPHLVITHACAFNLKKNCGNDQGNKLFTKRRESSQETQPKCLPCCDLCCVDCEVALAVKMPSQVTTFWYLLAALAISTPFCCPALSVSCAWSFHFLPHSLALAVLFLSSSLSLCRRGLRYNDRVINH